MNVLVVDDNSDNRATLADFLVGLGHRAFECGDGHAAIELLRNERVHLVYTDVKMPGMDGHELLKRIKGSPEWKDIEVVLITAYGDVKHAVEAMRDGAYYYLLKPVNMPEVATLTRRIQEYLALREENRELTTQFEEKLTEATQDIARELVDARQAYARAVGTGSFGVFSKAIREVFDTARRYHRNRDIPVLIEGETGTGKEVVARVIHYGDGNIATPFVAVNCAAITPTLFESELFGYEAGAYTGGKPKGQKGKLELAAGGAIFLDEITEIEPDYQAKLLRVLEDGEYYRVGGLKALRADARVICATNRDMRQMVESGAFREDLYYRLNAGSINIPPLRERREEILPLCNMFLQQLKQEKKTRFQTVSTHAGKMLEEYQWPGNVRELRNIMERLASLWDDTEVQPHHLEFLFEKTRPQASGPSLAQEYTPRDCTLPDTDFALNEWVLDVVHKALIKHRWNKTRTATYLGISRDMLYSYIKKLDESRKE